MRDVYLGGVFQRVNPPLIAIFAFILGSAVFLLIGAVKARQSFAVLWQQRRVMLGERMDGVLVCAQAD